ncbi:T9SS type B sorting domain-containing protein [uncultured Kordia sp.]|uniref:T9SS type B sorting domain-containing protein n=1 Tax=uncultured Kordia sp. TaxID=507699 RepID=UPI00261CB808|nr:T9SS type B sorting domain-containing protein [uncultured Kordia sp.]
MKENTLKLFCVLFFFCTTINAQRETANWFFGVNAGLDFNTGTPSLLGNSQVNTLEGCSTISDEDGYLLFYTDGITVWNRMQGIMPNGTGLIGSFSSTQSSIIVPNPDNPDIYYIFTADVVDAYDPDTNESNGFNYSIVDMTLNNGLGDVTDKNVNLMPNTSEKVSSVLSSDGNFWVVTHYEDSFYAFKVTGTGVNTVPVISSTSFSVSDHRNTRGNMKISPNGEKIAIAHTFFFPEQTGYLYLYDFDSENGTVSNSNFLGGNISYYGVEFSSNSSKLYSTGKIYTADNTLSYIQLQQYDIDAANVSSTRYILYSYEQSQVAPSLGGSLQIAFDRKIYHSLPGARLSTINSPNLAGQACNFQIENIDLGTDFARFGLPAFAQSYFESIALIQNQCLGEETTFTVEDTTNIVSINWNFGDAASGVNNTSTQISPSHVFTSTGQYIVTADVTYVNLPSRTFNEVIVISEAPDVVDMPYSIEQCDIDSDPNDGITIFDLQVAEDLILANTTTNNVQVSFFEALTDAELNENAINTTNYINTVNDQIIYAKVFETPECFTIRTVQLMVSVGGYLDQYTNIDICELDTNEIAISQIITELSQDFPGATISVYLSNNDAVLDENQLSDSDQIDSSVSALFFRVAYGTETCFAIGNLTINVIAQPQAEDQLVFLCGAGVESVTLALEGNFASYTWSTNDTTPTITVTETGIYTVVITNGAGCEKEVTFEVVEVPPIEVTSVEVSDFQDRNSMKIILGNTNTDAILYSINGGTTFFESNEFTNLAPGVYTIVVKRESCDVTSEVVLIGGFPKFFTPNGDNVNDTWSLVAKEFYPNAIIQLYDRYGKNLDYIKADREWDGTYRGSPLPAGDYWYKLTLEDGRTIKGNVTLKR